MPATTHQPISIDPKILYYGMPVILVTTQNEDGTTNISPLSSSWALGRNIVLGIGLGGKALENLQRTPQLVINVPDHSLWQQVELLAPLTGKYPVPDYKLPLGIRYEKDKFAAAGLTALASTTVAPLRIAECPIQMECTVQRISIPDYAPYFSIVETQVEHVHAHDELVQNSNQIDPAKWNPLIYNFRHYYSLGEHLGTSYREKT
ncbi:flavin reductase family protein [Paenibacillus sp. 481]|uniref:flavin reductase family protein n=1 Tax=Paenibacillus sp. 481 TaxID=2835869 RepID=UPI001E31BE8D|nr:flavin reductase family protein [Paenibacillus sp. 481]UHA74557.1 flavin reductase family protein [Paenibacillus sp. 481]